MLGKRADSQILAGVPEGVGPRVMTFRGGAVHSARQPGSQTFASVAHCVAVMLAPSPKTSAAFGSDKIEEFDAATGMIAVSPAGVDSRMTWPAPRENIVVAITPESMAELAAHEFDKAGVELRPTHRVLDHTALQFARLIKAELCQPDWSNELYLDSLITVLATHVLRNYSSIARPKDTAKGKLSFGTAKLVRDYLHDNFTRKISVSELAAICGLSPSHFTLAFTKTFGVPPYRYLLERRLDFAETLLAETNLPISEVAFLSGFSSQSHLANMMAKHRGTTPHQLRT